MAIVLRSATVTASAYAAVINKPSGVASGDLLMYWSWDEIETGPASPISGFTTLATSNPFDPGGYQALSIQYRIADGSEGATFALDATNYIGSMARISGVDVADPFASDHQFGSTSNNTSANIFSVTTTQDDTVLLMQALWASSASNPEPVTIGGDTPDILMSGFAGERRFGWHTEAIAATGATGNRAVTSTVSCRKYSSMVALTPASEEPEPEPSTGFQAFNGLLLPV